MKHLLLGILIMVAALNVIGQNSDSLSHDNSGNLPKLDGSLKTKVEFNTDAGTMRFEVRNARLGARGNVNEYISYRAEVDLSDEGKIRMLDAFVKFTPIKNLDIYLGQRKVPFGTDYLRNPVETIFANRSFVAKYVNDGLRDIGLVGNYKFFFHIPIELWLSAMNGTGNNNPQWIDRPNYSARIGISPLKNIRLVANYYQGATITEKQLTMTGAEIRYQTKKLLIESEYLQRKFVDTTNKSVFQDAFYIHSYYNFFTNAKMIKMISPVVRWDFMGNSSFANNIANRLTAGINFGFEPKQFKAEIRLNYEKYFKKYYPTHFDKFTIEFIANFR